MRVMFKIIAAMFIAAFMLLFFACPISGGFLSALVACSYAGNVFEWGEMETFGVGLSTFAVHCTIWVYLYNHGVLR